MTDGARCRWQFSRARSDAPMFSRQVGGATFGFPPRRRNLRACRGSNQCQGIGHALHSQARHRPVELKRLD
jgi:ribosomal protein L34E